MQVKLHCSCVPCCICW